MQMSSGGKWSRWERPRHVRGWTVHPRTDLSGMDSNGMEDRQPDTSWAYSFVNVRFNGLSSSNPNLSMTSHRSLLGFWSPDVGVFAFGAFAVLILLNYYFFSLNYYLISFFHWYILLFSHLTCVHEEPNGGQHPAFLSALPPPNIRHLACFPAGHYPLLSHESGHPATGIR